MNNTIKLLLNDESKALKGLHESFRFDWNKPLQAKLIIGNTTLNKILSQVDYGNDYQVIVLTKPLGEFYRCHRWNVVEVLDKSTFNIEFNNKSFSYHTRKLDYYHRKSDFKDDLKDPNGQTIVISQKREYLSNPYKKREIDPTQRYKIVSPERENAYYTYAYNSSNRWISHIDVFDIHSSGEKLRYEVYDRNALTISDVIDKSGYLLPYFKNELNNKVRIEKSRRAKEAYLATDNSQKLEELSIRMKAKKLELIEKFKNANTYDELKEFNEKFGAWHGYLDCVIDFERIMKNVNDKQYPSVESFNNAYQILSNKLLAI